MFLYSILGLCSIILLNLCHVPNTSALKELAAKAKDTYTAGNKAVEAVSEKLMKEAWDYFCDHAGEWGPFAAKGFGLVACTPEGKDKEYCKFVGNSKMVFGFLCGAGKEFSTDFMTKMIKCARENDAEHKQSCAEAAWESYKEIEGIAEMVKDQMG